MYAVIMAGGKGTRIASVASDIPKPMIPINGKPILQYQMECLKNQNITDIILIVGHLGNVIREYFGDGGGFGINIGYIEEKEPLGTAGALYYLKETIKEDFLLLNGDVIFDVDMKRLMDFHRRKGGVATILTHPNNHPYDSGIIVADKEKRVVQWMHKEDERLYYKNRVNAGIHMLSPRIFSAFRMPEKKDLDRDILKPLIASGELFAYDSPEYVKDMGTPDRYYKIAQDIENGKVSQKNLNKKQKAVFFDRDGTLNIYKGFINKCDALELAEGAPEAVKMVNDSGCLAIVITNQPVIARGECTVEQLDLIHNRLETLLGEKGTYIDDLFYCPHHPDKGFDGEVMEYKIDCECRKPKPGLFYKAAEKYNIDLSQSWMIGDDERDRLAGEAAGCRVVLVSQEVSLVDAVKKALQKEERE